MTVLHLPRPRVVCPECGHGEELGHPVRHVVRLATRHHCAAVVDTTAISGDTRCDCPGPCHRA